MPTGQLHPPMAEPASTTTCAATTARLLPACQDANYITPVDPIFRLASAAGPTTSPYYSDNLNTNFNALPGHPAAEHLEGPGLHHELPVGQRLCRQCTDNNYVTWDRHVGHGRDSNVRLQQMTWYGTYELPFGKGKQFASGVNGADQHDHRRMATVRHLATWQAVCRSRSTTTKRAPTFPAALRTYPSYTGSAKMKTNLTGFRQSPAAPVRRTYYTKQTSNLLTDPGTGIFKNPGPRHSRQRGPQHLLWPRVLQCRSLPQQDGHHPREHRQ